MGVGFVRVIDDDVGPFVPAPTRSKRRVRTPGCECRASIVAIRIPTTK